MTTMLDMGLGTLTVLGCCLALWLLIRGISAPLAKLKDHAGRVAQGEFSNVPIRQADEVGQLAEAFNIMVGHIKEKLGMSQGIMRGITLPFAAFDVDCRLTYVNRACWPAGGIPAVRKTTSAEMPASFFTLIPTGKRSATKSWESGMKF